VGINRSEPPKLNRQLGVPHERGDKPRFLA